MPFTYNPFNPLLLRSDNGDITLTRKSLISAHACAEQVMLFMEIFGDTAVINSDNLRKAYNQGLDIFWFAHYFVKDRRAWNKRFQELCVTYPIEEHDKWVDENIKAMLEYL